MYSGGLYIKQFCIIFHNIVISVWGFIKDLQRVELLGLPNVLLWEGQFILFRILLNTNFCVESNFNITDLEHKIYFKKKRLQVTGCLVVTRLNCPVSINYLLISFSTNFQMFNLK